MNTKTPCIFCPCTDVWDMGIEFIEDDSARHEYRCPECGGQWQLNGHIDIQWDSERQINRYPTKDFWGVKHHKNGGKE